MLDPGEETDNKTGGEEVIQYDISVPQLSLTRLHVGWLSCV